MTNLVNKGVLATPTGTSSASMMTTQRGMPSIFHLVSERRRYAGPNSKAPGLKNADTFAGDLEVRFSGSPLHSAGVQS